MLAAQLMSSVKRDLSDEVVNRAMRLENDGAELRQVTAWLHEKVWSKGSLLTTEEIVVGATGEPLNVKYFKAHLEKRYL